MTRAQSGRQSLRSLMPKSVSEVLINLANFVLADDSKALSCLEAVQCGHCLGKACDNELYSCC